ncbi:multiubiquitin domain-containing protein [Methylophilus sp. 3sh_L]|uniref:multiubiquitin domain-containing protein n=1 Tax=Methylophilus sp. 3sh_L TaxID=3377114 RepID=UPI00398EC0FB
MSKISIVVNGSQEFWTDTNVTYAQIVQIAFPGSQPDTLFSVTYALENGATGSLALGQSVAVQNGMQFEVITTYRS